MISWTFKGTTEHSDLGLKPGHWPNTLTVTTPDGKSHTLARGGEDRDRERELLAVHYFNEEVTVQVFND